MTEPRFLLDSNICIYVLQGGSEMVRDRMQTCAPGELVTSAVAYAEVVRGVSVPESLPRQQLEAFFDIVVVLPFDRQAAARYRQIPFKRGTFDRLIAAHALSLGLTLVTNNERDFADVPGLTVENWTRP